VRVDVNVDGGGLSCPRIEGGRGGGGGGGGGEEEEYAS